MKADIGIRLCTVGALVHEAHHVGREDLRTYRSLSAHVGRIYLIAISPDRRHHVSRSGNVIVVTLAQTRGTLRNRVAFLAGAVRVGYRLYRESGVNIYAASDPLFSGLTGLVLRRLSHKPLLVHLQGQLLDLPPGGASGLRRWAMVQLARFVCRRANMVRCVSKDLIRSATAVRVPASRLAYLPSRVDTERFSPTRAAALRHGIRRELGAERNRVLLFIGTFSHHKGVEHLVGALPSVLRRHPEARLVLVGSGPLEARLRESSNRLGVSESVVFVGRTSHERIPHYLAAADVLVLPSLNEGLPRVILEAMASALPVVATAVGGVPELVVDGSTGVLVRPGDEEALAEAISRVLADPGMAGSFGRAGREVVEREYEREANIRSYARLVESVAHSAPRAR